MIKGNTALDRGTHRGLKCGIAARMTVAHHEYGCLSGSVTISASPLLMV